MPSRSSQNQPGVKRKGLHERLEQLMNAIADALIEDGGICIIYEINLNTICQRIEELSQALSEDASLQVDWDTFRDDLLGALQK